MECNKDEAIRAKDIAEKKLLERDVKGAKKFALKAQRLFPKLDGLSQFLEIINVYIAHELKINEEPDYYGILRVDPFIDEDSLKKQYRRMALSLHPDKNKSVGADGAFKILSQAWSVLSNKDTRRAYNLKLNIQSPNWNGNASSTSAWHTTYTNGQYVPTPPRTPGTVTAQQYTSLPNHRKNARCTTNHVQCHQKASPVPSVAGSQCNNVPGDHWQQTPCTTARQPATADVHENPAPNIHINPTQASNGMHIPNYPNSSSTHMDFGFTSIPHLKSPASGAHNQCHPSGKLKRTSAQATAAEYGRTRPSFQHKNAAATSRLKSDSYTTTTETFWTSCNRCRIQYEYDKVFINQMLMCPRCKLPFLAIEIPAPTVTSRGSRIWPLPHQQQGISSASSGSRNVPASATGNSSEASSKNLKSMHEAAANMAMNHEAQTDNRSLVPGKVESASGLNAASSHLKKEKTMKRKQVGCRAGDSSKDGNQGAPEKVEAASAVNAASNKLNGEKPMKRRREDGHNGESNDRIQGTAENVEAASTLLAASGILSREKPMKKRQVDGQQGSKDGIQGTVKRSGRKKKSEILKGDFGAEKQSNSKELSQIEIRSMLIKKVRMEIMKQIKEREAENSKTIAETKDPSTVLKNDSNNNLRTQSSGSSFSDPKTTLQPMKSSTLKESDDTDANLDETISMTVPDANFHNFDDDRVEDSFADNQVWAAYDDDDAMPRYYALIHHVISRKPFKLEISWLNSKSTSEFGSLAWIESGFTKTIGDFRVGKLKTNKRLNSFSHPVKWWKGPRGVIQIFPVKGDVWALFKNWSRDWNEETADEVIHKYNMVEVLEDYSEDKGVTVAPLVKVAGFTSVFSQIPEQRMMWTIPREEIFRFSHQVPFFRLSALEDRNAPKGCYELDPAALPLELLTVITEAEAAKAADDRVSEHHAMLRELKAQSGACAKPSVGNTHATEDGRGAVEGFKHVLTYSRRNKGRKIEWSVYQSQGRTTLDES